MDKLLPAAVILNSKPVYKSPQLALVDSVICILCEEAQASASILKLPT